MKEDPTFLESRIRELEQAIVKIEQDNQRLRAGNWTKEEIHNIRHKLHATVDAEQFADRCAEDQIKLYGYCVDREKIRGLEYQLHGWRDEALQARVKLRELESILNITKATITSVISDIKELTGYEFKSGPVRAED